MHGQPAAAQELDQRLAQLDAGVVAGDRHGPDVGAAAPAPPSSGGACPSRTTVIRRSLQRVLRQRRDVPARASVTVSPRGSTRASVSVMISNRFIEV